MRLAPALVLLIASTGCAGMVHSNIVRTAEIEAGCAPGATSITGEQFSGIEKLWYANSCGHEMICRYQSERMVCRESGRSKDAAARVLAREIRDMEKAEAAPTAAAE